MRDNRGMTLVELIIVLAVIAIIGAIIVPNFLTATDSARLKSDIQSARVIGNAIALYNAEQSHPIAGATADDVIDTLHGSGYIVADDVAPQTGGAKWKLDGASVLLDITGCGETDSKIRTEAYNKLSDHERRYVWNGS